ncbi:zinc finger protein 827-like [Salvelinus sp. IW2-2015]|uniref:zinc finger protein 827-like n=1 Tax=Salvelinus sp. IW2-2015 TaxID=2691554 RepID=UPI0038D462F8
MEVDPASGPAPPSSHLLAFSTLGPCEKSEPWPASLRRLSAPEARPLLPGHIGENGLRALFQLSEKVSKANDHKDSNMVGISSPFLDERFRQSPFSQRSKSSSPAEASSSARTALHGETHTHHG